MKLFITLIISFMFLSCNPQTSIIVLDEYFTEINNINIENSKKYRNVIVEEFIIDDYLIYEDVLVSPLLYKIFIKEWDTFKGELYILNVLDDNLSEKRNFIQIDDSESYEKIIEIVNNSEYYNNITVIMDYESSNNKTCADLFDKLNNKEFELLRITRSSSRNKIKSFINNNVETDLWIIDSKKYGLYSYDLIQDGDILLYGGENLQNGNDKIKFSIDVNYEEYFESNLLEKSDKIFSQLKIF